MAWIESHTVLIRHRKLLGMAADLNIEPVLAMGHLHALWHAVLEQQEDGDLREWSDQMIAQAAAYHDGDPTKFVSVLEQRRWLDGRILHDWIDYTGHFLIKKYSTSNIQKLRSIWKLHGYKYGKRDNKSLFRIANRKRTESEQKANLPNLTKPNPTKPNQEEKESKKEKENGLVILGEFKRVKLTQEQLEKLKARFGEQDTQDKITALDVYLESKGPQKYKSHYATILNWDRMQQDKDKPGRI